MGTSYAEEFLGKTKCRSNGGILRSAQRVGREIYREVFAKLWVDCCNDAANLVPGALRDREELLRSLTTGCGAEVAARVNRCGQSIRSVCETNGDHYYSQFSVCLDAYAMKGREQ